MRILRLLLVPVLASFWALSPAWAAPIIVYDNTARVTGGDDLISAAGPAYDSFSNGAAATLSGLKLNIFAVAPTDGGSISIGLYANSGTNTPGGLLASLGTVLDSALTASIQTITVSPLATPALSANTRYWIGLTATGSARWSFSKDALGTGVANEFFSSFGVPQTNSNLPYQMQVTVDNGVTVTGAPEPASLVVLGVGLVGLIATRRRSLV